MALDVDKLSSSGNVTATAINAAYQNLDLKCDRYEVCVTNFIKGILKIAGLDDVPTYKRTKMINMSETTTMILAAAQYLDDETILNLLPFVSVDQVKSILKKKDEEESARFANDTKDDDTDENGNLRDDDGQGETAD